MIRVILISLLMAMPAMAAKTIPRPWDKPVKCWSCDQIIPPKRDNCPGCGAPRNPPKYRY
jgi:rRNA maturation endonuclease Nob1